MSNNKKQCTNQPHVKLEFAEELNLPPRLRPKKSGSVAQNTARPIQRHPKGK
jgi:hypothetical protein